MDFEVKKMEIPAIPEFNFEELKRDIQEKTTKYENGERLPSLEYFYRFCVKFNLSMDRILNF